MWTILKFKNLLEIKIISMLDSSSMNVSHRFVTVLINFFVHCVPQTKYNIAYKYDCFFNTETIYDTPTMQNQWRRECHDCVSTVAEN